MINWTARAASLLLGLLGALGCGPSALQLRLQRENAELRKDLAQQRQQIADLRVRMQMDEARNRVLIDLVQGLTSDPEHADGIRLKPAHQSLAALDADTERLIATVQHSREDMEALRAQRKALSDELAQAKHTIEDARAEEAQMNARLSEFRALLARLAPLIDRGELEVRIADQRLVLQLPEAALFESGQSHITRDGQGVLDGLAEALRSVEMREFQIGGHTDGTAPRSGRFQNNWQLSAARAIEIMQYLSWRGVPKQRLSAAAYGDTQPLADESTPEGRAKNRRTEIVLLPNSEELPDLSALNDLVHKPEPQSRSDQPVPGVTPEDDQPVPINTALSALPELPVPAP